jgi:tetratricopeptide (TPR) repeat protein
MRSTLRLLIFVLIAVWSNAVRAQQPPIRVPTDEAMRSIEKLVEPSPVTTVPGNAVTADVVIAIDGHVESVRVLEGEPAHVQSATDALKQWKFSPLTRNGKVVRAIAKLAVYVPDSPPSKEPELSVRASEQLRDCSALVNSRQFAPAEAVCTKAVEAANTLRAGAVLERSSAHAWLGHALLFQGRPQEALAHYREELALDQQALKSDDADLASAYRYVAMAYVAMRQFGTADQNYERAVKIMEAAIVSLPSMKANYQPRLKTMLLEQAEVKRSLGDQTGAVALETKAERTR